MSALLAPVGILSSILIAISVIALVALLFKAARDGIPANNLSNRSPTGQLASESQENLWWIFGVGYLLGGGLLLGSSYLARSFQDIRSFIDELGIVLSGFLIAVSIISLGIMLLKSMMYRKITEEAKRFLWLILLSGFLCGVILFVGILSISSGFIH